MSESITIAHGFRSTERDICDDVRRVMAVEEEVTPFAETVVEYADYSSASKGACAWADQGRVKVDPTKLVLYPRYDSRPYFRADS